MARFVLTTPVLPWPPDQGSKAFQLEVARGLLAVGPVRWISREVGDQGEAIERLSGEGFDLRLDRGTRDRSLPQRIVRRLRSEVRSRMRGIAREELFVCTDEVRRLVAESVLDWPDAFGVAAYWSATPALEEFARGRRIYAVSDVDSVRESRGPGADARIAAAERRALLRSDLALTLSEEDREDALTLLAGDPPPRFGRCPVSISIPARPGPAPADGELLLYGHWEAPFNRDGLRWFLRECWPRIRDHESLPRLRIVGAGAPEPIDDDRVSWVGFVDDLAAELARARAVLIPLRYASGLRYRLLEAFAHRRCVIATAVAARGSGAEAGRHYLEADDAEAWLEALDRLDDRMAIDAYDWVAKNHSRAGLGARWADALSPVLDS